MARWHCVWAILMLGAGLLFSSQTSRAQDGLPTVKVNISGLKGTDGVALVALYDSAGSWLKVPHAIQVLRLKITGAAISAEYKGVKPGTYAVSVIHDANGNNEMDMRWVPWPQPKEGSAISNDPRNATRAVAGPPTWDSAKFEVTAAGATVNATVKYFN